MYQKQNHFWQFLVRGWSARKLKKLNQERSRQIKRLSVSGTLSGSQIDSATFQTKEGQRHQVNKVISNKAVVQPSSGKGQPSQSANLPKIEKNQEDFKNKDQDKQKEKEQEQKQEKISKLTPKMEAESQNKIEQQRFRDLQQRVEQKSWTRPTITETNLIKGQTTLYFNWRRFWLDLIQWLVITLFFLSLCGVLFYLWRQNQNKQTTDTVQRLAKVDQLVTLAENEVGDVLDFRLRLMLVSELLNSHIYWSNFFSFLEKNTLPNVFYQDFSGDTSGEYILKARTDNFDSMAKQLKVLRRAADVLEVDSEGGDMIKNEPVVDESGTSSEVTTTPATQLHLSIKLKIKPELFFFFFFDKLLNKKNSLRQWAEEGKSGILAEETATKQGWQEFFINNYRLFIALICILIMVGSVLLFFLPQYLATLAEFHNNNQSAQAELAKKQKYQANLLQLRAFYDNIDQNTRSKVIDILPVQLDKECLLAEIEAICLANNLLIKSSDVLTAGT